MRNAYCSGKRILRLPPPFCGVRRAALRLLPAALLCVGCDRSEKKVDGPLPQDVLMEVNGVPLYKEAAQRAAFSRFEAFKSDVPQDRHADMKRDIERMVLNQFLSQTLLFQEGKKRGFEATEDEVNQALERMESRFPEGHDLQTLARSRPALAMKMRQDVVSGIVINKFLESALPKEAIKVSEAEMDKWRQGIRRARHILIKTEADDAPAVRENKKALAEDLRRRIAEGEDFAALARQHSDCPSRQKGGYLGHFPKGKMVPEFDAAVFALKAGDLGPVVETPFGYHVVEVMENEINDVMVRQDLEVAKHKKNVDALVEQLKKKAVIRYAEPAPTPTRP
jgi:peptidyl-prolyl cis-trans isomerase C